MLFALRSIALFLIFTMFLSIIFVTKINTYSKPVLICAVDNSRSMLAAKDSTAVKSFFANDYSNIINKLEENFTVHSVIFDDVVNEGKTPDFHGNSTNISSSMMYSDRLYDKNSIDGMLLLTDGIFTNGFDPAILAEGIPYPVYTVGTGDTTSIKDYSITNLRFNDIVYIQNNYVFEVSIKALGFNNENLTLQIYDNNKLVSTRNIEVNNNAYHSTLELTFPPAYAGKHFFKFRLIGSEGDEIKNNNEKTCVVNVIDTKKRVILLAKGAHPDVGAIKRALEPSQNYNCESFLIEKFNISELDKADIVILHGIPDKSSTSKLIINKIEANKLPYLAIFAEHTDINSFNLLNKNLNIEAYNSKFEEAYPNFNNNFSGFKINENEIKAYSSYPPLSAPFGIYNIPTQSEVLFTQKISNTLTTRPLIITVQDYNYRSAFVFGEGLWRWRIKNFIAENNHQSFDALINNVVQYLSLSDIFKKYQVNINEEYFEGEEIIIRAKLYNDNYELFNTPDAQIVITNNEQKAQQYPYYFSKSEDGSYTLNAGTLPAGQYSWRSTAANENADGAFYISETNPEYVDLQAKHDMLKTLSSITGGKFSELSNVKDIAGIIKSDIKSSKEYSYLKHNKINDSILIFFLAIALLGVEWLLRRRAGIY